MSGLVICFPHGVEMRRVMECPTCGRRRRFVGLAEVWHDTIWTCCACGDAFSAYGRMERPFRRGWRKEAVRKARARWAAALPQREADEAFAALLAESLGAPEGEGGEP